MSTDRPGWRGWQALAGVAAGLVVLLAVAMLPAAAQPKETLQLSMEPVHQRLVDAAWRAGERIVEGYNKSPILVIGLALAGGVPLLAGIFAFGRAMRRRREEVATTPSAPLTETPRAGDKAWIEYATEDDRSPVLFAGELLRIGRHSDNDIALDHVSVHRHHALIQRTPDHEFVLIDYTAGTGNALLLNGAPTSRATLRDGDRITVGQTNLVFRLGADAPASVHGLRVREERPSHRTPKENRNDQRDAADESTGRAADRIETRRIGPADRVVARGADRRRS